MNAGSYRGADLEKEGFLLRCCPCRSVRLCSGAGARTGGKAEKLTGYTERSFGCPLRDQLPRVIEQELMMHEKTFHHEEVKSRIKGLYGN